MKVDLVGKIKNTRLPRYKPLLPMFEAVINSFQALEDAAGSLISPLIEVVVERDPLLEGLGLESDGDVSGFTVVDNGVGFNDLNLESFFTSDTQVKVAKGGKGLGRFIWLKAFDQVRIESHYLADGHLWKRAFDFTMTGEQPTEPPSVSEEKEPKTIVRLVGMKSPYRELCPRALDAIGQRLIEHCLPFFMDPNCPAVSVADVKNRIDLKSYFHEKFATKATSHNFQVGGNDFTLKGLRLYNAHEMQHRLMYAANFREVIIEKLEKYLPNLQRHRLDDEKGEPFVYLGFIEGLYLNQSVNSERTGFSFPTEEGDDTKLFGETTLNEIREGALGAVTDDLRQFLEEINQEKEITIRNYIEQEAPEYRPLARYLNEFIDHVPPGAQGANLETVLHEQMYKKQKELRQESRVLMSESDKQGLEPEEYETKLNDFLQRANEIGKSSLAQYVAHRKVILEFLERSLQVDPDTGRYPLEEVIHRIIYPMRTTSDEVPYEQQNLWIIDERLSYHWFLASDLPFSGIDVLVNESKSRPDIMIFERALTFAEDDAVLNSIVIVEFKKPDRDSYKEDPIDQVLRLIREIKSGHYKDKMGREIKVQSQQIPAYGYIICDTKREVEIMAENKGLLKTPDGLGYYGYNQALSAYVEIISYTKLVRDAKRRNRILFDKLHLPT